MLLKRKVRATMDHGENYMKVRPPLVYHILRNRLLGDDINGLMTENDWEKPYVDLSLFTTPEIRATSFLYQTWCVNHARYQFMWIFAFQMILRVYF